MAIKHGTEFSDGGLPWLFGTVTLGLIGTDEDDFIYGHAGNDILSGGYGQDWLDGGTGADEMYGEAGNDTYIVDQVDDQVSETNALNAGYDTVISRISYTLPSNVERLQFFQDEDAFQGVGNALNNDISGNMYNNALYGMQGDDNIWGYEGHDDIWGGSGIDTLYGGAGDDELYGETNTDTLYGGAGNDTLDGGSSGDVMSGGLNDDTYIVENTGDQVIEYSGEGRDTVYSRLPNYTLTSNVENLVLYSPIALNGEGNTLDNGIVGNSLDNVLSGHGGNDTLFGLEGHDTLNGGLGDDQLYGGIGNDTYIVRDSLDAVHEYANEGIDTVNATANYQLSANVENLNLVSASYGLGNDLANTITGGREANTLDGGGAADTLIGRGGDDTYMVDNAGDIVTEVTGEGSDTVITTVSYTLAENTSVERLEAFRWGSANSINLTGNSIANTVIGNDGSNLINGGGGIDTLTGGGGQDYFLFNTTLGAANVDTISDFSVAADTVYLENSIFATLATPGNLARNVTSAEFHIGSAAHDADDRIIYNSQNGALTYDADGNGAGAAIQFATVTLGLSLTTVDFLVI
ncbi:calcium-binding protein [Bradyrhizobium sp. JYMT SZCCT0428]|uniref:calcium-binding protein n=1 Tax=Bradyrhizobium sp. JYMT SZCCT0428 TaxID=2807673 RepID=UPI001BA4AB9C|nr:calcium-binding protein [Bradyrhizobium sp. JYMT SZCCT0428]MBR1154060.1 calcium-binding protein [Bradyrhizobium sp. JYMT SZCCT0428]